jgi:hypothetical protein
LCGCNVFVKGYFLKIFSRLKSLVSDRTSFFFYCMGCRSDSSCKLLVFAVYVKRYKRLYVSFMQSW